MNAPAAAVQAEEDAALAAAIAAAPSPYETTIDLASYVREREGMRDEENAAGAVEVLSFVPIDRPGFFRRVFGGLFGPPQVSQTEIAARLLASWTFGKPASADEVTTGLAVLTARQILTLTGGR